MKRNDETVEHDRPLPCLPLPATRHTTATMCERDALDSLPPEAFAKMPSFLSSDDPLLNIGKKELLAALRIASENSWVADWLFSNNANAIHRQHPLPPEAFQNSLALHLRHDISTPNQCPNATKPVSQDINDQFAPNSRGNFTVSKDIDLLLVPVADVKGITVGHSFLRGVHHSSMPSPSPQLPGAAAADKGFFSGRFAFDNARRDFLMVVNGMSPFMTGIVSMRWCDVGTRERSFFAIPKADYGPNCLPSRVLSMQNNVEFALPSRPNFQFQTPRHCMSNVTSPGCKTKTEPQCPPTDFSVSEPMLDARPPSPGFAFESNTLEASWSDGLENLGTVVGTDDDANRVIAELLQEFSANSSMDDVDKLLNSTNIPLSIDQIDEDSLLPSTSQLELAIPSSTTPWDATNPFGTADGVGIPRRPGKNDTSSGAFSMCTLTDSLAAIERTLKGHFFGPKVRKDILHPLTGELVSRCTGEVIAKTDAVDPLSMNILRETAAQAYYSSMLSISNDARLLTAPPQKPEPLPDALTNGLLSEEVVAIEAIRRQSFGTSPVQSQVKPISPTPPPAPMKRSAPANLAPRPAPGSVPPNGAPFVSAGASTVLTSDVSSSDSGRSAKLDKEAAAEAKKEAKRIKNRLSAAKSNQKRRAQLEAQKKELAVLKERVQELRSRKDHISEENEYLKKQILSNT